MKILNKKKNFFIIYLFIIKNIHFFLKWIVFSFSFQFYKKFFFDRSVLPPQNNPSSVRFIQKKKKKKNRSLTSIVSHQYAFSFHKKPVCNLIKREVSKSTKESSIDLCNSSPNAASIFPSIFPLPLGRNSIVRIDAPKCKKTKKSSICRHTRTHGSFAGS